MSINGSIDTLDITDLALKQLSNHDVLTAEEEQQLTQAYKKSQTIADRNKLVEQNTRLVIKIAKRYQNRGLPLVDLIEHGCLGLMHGIEKFNPDRGFKLSTYATWWIRQTIEKAIMDEGKVIRIPVHVCKEINKCLGAQKELQKTLLRDATIEEIAEAAKKSPEEVTELFEVSRQTYALQEQELSYNDEESSPLEGLAVSDEGSPHVLFFKDRQIEELNKLLDGFKDKNKAKVLRMRFGIYPYETHTLEKVSEEIGLSRERVRQLQKDALSELKTILKGGKVHSNRVSLNNNPENQTKKPAPSQQKPKYKPRADAPIVFERPKENQAFDIINLLNCYNTYIGEPITLTLVIQNLKSTDCYNLCLKEPGFMALHNLLLKLEEDGQKEIKVSLNPALGSQDLFVQNLTYQIRQQAILPA